MVYNLPKVKEIILNNIKIVYFSTLFEKELYICTYIIYFISNYLSIKTIFMKNQIWSVLIACGIALSGYFLYCGIESFTTVNRVVTARGLSERQVLADKAVWTISFEISGNQIEDLYERLEPKKKALVKFLLDNGISEEEIVFSPSTATDRSTWYDWEKRKGSVDQYVLTGHLNVVSSDVETVRKLQLRQLDLIHSGVVLENSYIQYEYTGLNDLKPEMIEEATKNARVVANKFAEDADCKLGSIKSARQGQFEVESDEVMPHMRKVRVVTTIEYFLK